MWTSQNLSHHYFKVHTYWPVKQQFSLHMKPVKNWTNCAGTVLKCSLNMVLWILAIEYCIVWCGYKWVSISARALFHSSPLCDMNYYSTTGKAHVDFHQKSLQRLQNAIHVIIDAHIMCKKTRHTGSLTWLTHNWELGSVTSWKHSTIKNLVHGNQVEPTHVYTKLCRNHMHRNKVLVVWCSFSHHHLLNCFL